MALERIAGSFLNGTPLPGQITTDPSVMPNDQTLRAIADIANARIKHFASVAEARVRARGGVPEEDPEYLILEEIRSRKGLLESEQSRLRALFRWLDNLYYPDVISEGGPDHWPLSNEQRRKGVTHTSVNSPPVYVDIPAALQAVPPIENYVPAGPEQHERDAAGRRERLYFGWKEDEEFELKVHQSCVVKGLYGFTYGKVFWDAIESRPTVTIIDRPENLYVGWGDSNYRRMDWTIYCYGLSPQAIRETWDMAVDMVEGKDGYVPVVRSATDHSDPIDMKNQYSSDVRGTRPPSGYEQMQIEVYDYWYKKPAGKGKRPEVWNAIYVGNQMVKNARHKEYDDIPYVPLPNTYIPGYPYGRAELYDLAQLIREKDERISNAGAMLAGVVDGQMWQITGSEAPDQVSDNFLPRPNRVATPGPNARLEALQPFVPQFALEDFLKRIDAEMEVVSGLNELLLGRAPATILGSSKAIAALVANYEARIRMRRDLLYQWRKRIWKMAAKVWAAKDKDVRDLIDGHYRIDVQAPELNPRDGMEEAQKAINLVQNNIWSRDRAMDATGVEDPGQEKVIIREEQTDPAISPDAVTKQITMVGTMQQLGITPPQGSVNQAQQAAGALQAGPAGTSSLNAPENQSNPPPSSLPANAQPGGPAQPTNNAPGVGKAVLQTMVTGSDVKGRVLTSTPLGG